MSAAAKDCIVRIFRSATASTNQLTRAKRGRIWDCAMASRSRRFAVDPRNPEHISVAVAGHPYGPNEERGIFRSVDGGKTFREERCTSDENTGAAMCRSIRANPQIVYASLWESREGPWENGSWNGTTAAFSSRPMAARTWKQLTKGLPDEIVQATSRSRRARPKTLFAAVATNDRETLSVG